jgi:selenide, water dikinase
MALAIVGMPIGKLSPKIIHDILRGGESVCAAVGIPIAGGHSIDSQEPIYGLVALGVVHPDKVKRNIGAQAGDALVLGKGLGIGVMSAALKKGELSAQGYAQMLESTTQLNTPGSVLAHMHGVHALTDVTGFALLGHLLEVCRGSHLGAEIEFGRLPVLPVAWDLAQKGYAPGAAERNWASYGHEVKLAAHLGQWQKNLLCDPQTSGGLLVACTPEVAEDVLDLFRQQGFPYARKIGHMTEGEAKVSVL